MTTAAIVGANIRAELARKRISQRQLADLLGMSGTGVSKRLSGITPIDVDELQQIAQFLDVPVSMLMQDAAA